MADVLSLLPCCQKCGAKCCIPGETIGAPIITKEECWEVFKLLGFGYFEKVSLPNGKHYCVPRKPRYSGYSGRCIFLKENKCTAQAVKFADCRAYPIKAIRKEARTIFVIDTHCPAARHLTPEFITKAKEVALQSLNQWDPEVYQHWLDNYIQWIKDAIELEAYLKLSDREKSALPVY